MVLLAEDLLVAPRQKMFCSVTLVSALSLREVTFPMAPHHRHTAPKVVVGLETYMALSLPMERIIDLTRWDLGFQNRSFQSCSGHALDRVARQKQ